MENKKYYQVVDELSAIRDSSPFGMTFRPMLELQYQQAFGLWYRDTIRTAALLAAFLLTFANIVQYFAGLTVNPWVEVGRIVSITALLATAWYVTKTKVLAYQHVIVMLNGLLAAVVIISFSISYPSPFKYIFYGAITLVQIFLFALIRMPFNYAFWGGFVILVLTNIGLAFESTAFEELAFLDFMLLAGTVLALMICRRMEKNARENYLHTLMLSMERDELKQQNAVLRDRLSCDAITRLLNRRAFEDAVLDEWNHAYQSQRKGFLIPIIIKQFKALNELRGNDVGDDLLRAIARTINNSLFESSDAAARISGSRFCLLLTNASQHEITRRSKKLQKGLRKLEVLRDPEVRAAGIELGMGIIEMTPTPEGDPRDEIERAFKELPSIIIHSETSNDPTQRLVN